MSGHDNTTGIPVSQMDHTQRVTWNVLLRCIADSKYNRRCHFYSALKNCIMKTNVRQLRSDDGFTLFHEVVRNKRADLMMVFQCFPSLTPLYTVQVNGNKINYNQYAGMTPTELADRLDASEEFKEMERLMRTEKSLSTDLLKQACRSGDVQIFKRELLQSGNHRVLMKCERDKRTCLDWAIVSGSTKMVKEVIKVERQIRHGRTDCTNQIENAVMVGNQNVIQLIIQYINCTDVDDLLMEGKPLMQKVTELGDIETFKTLVEIGASIPESTLAVASAYGRCEFLSECHRVYQKDLDVNYTDVRNKSALHFAVEKGHVTAIDFLITHGADMTFRDKQNRSLLHAAAKNGMVNVLNEIIDHARRHHVLHTLVDSTDNYLGSERCFLVRGRDKNQAAWHYVLCDRGLIDIFRIKTQGGAVDVAEFGQCLLSGWGRNPSEDKVQEVESQYDARNISSNAMPDMLPLHLAIMEKNSNVAVILAELTRDVNKLDSQSLTPLHYACMRGDMKVIATLLKNGAERNILDNRGRTAVQLAKENNHLEVVAYMEEMNRKATHPATQSFFDNCIAPVIKGLNDTELQRVAAKGHDVKQHIRDTLRSLVGDVNEFLFQEFESGPVVTKSYTSWY